MAVKDHNRHLLSPRRFAALPGLILVAAFAGCGAPGVADQASAATGSAGTAIVLTNFKVSGVPETLAAGKLTVSITNKGVGDHELLVFKSDLEPSQYPVDATGKVLEEDPGIAKVSDDGNISMGKSQQRTINLTAPGKYLFFCNLPGHFKYGMYRVVTVH